MGKKKKMAYNEPSTFLQQRKKELKKEESNKKTLKRTLLKGGCDFEVRKSSKQVSVWRLQDMLIEKEPKKCVTAHGWELETNYGDFIS